MTGMVQAQQEKLWGPFLSRVLHFYSSLTWCEFWLPVKYSPPPHPQRKTGLSGVELAVRQWGLLLEGNQERDKRENSLGGGEVLSMVLNNNLRIN